MPDTRATREMPFNPGDKVLYNGRVARIRGIVVDPGIPCQVGVTLPGNKLVAIQDIRPYMPDAVTARRFKRCVPSYVVPKPCAEPWKIGPQMNLQGE